MKRFITFILSVLLCFNSTMVIFAEEDINRNDEEQENLVLDEDENKETNDEIINENLEQNDDEIDENETSKKIFGATKKNVPADLEVYSFEQNTISVFTNDSDYLDSLKNGLIKFYGLCEVNSSNKKDYVELVSALGETKKYYYNFTISDGINRGYDQVEVPYDSYLDYFEGTGHKCGIKLVVDGYQDYEKEVSLTFNDLFAEGDILQYSENGNGDLVISFSNIDNEELANKFLSNFMADSFTDLSGKKHNNSSYLQLSGDAIYSGARSTSWDKDDFIYDEVNKKITIPYSVLKNNRVYNGYYNDVSMHVHGFDVETEGIVTLTKLINRCPIDFSLHQDSNKDIIISTNDDNCLTNLLNNGQIEFYGKCLNGEEVIENDFSIWSGQASRVKNNNYYFIKYTVDSSILEDDIANNRIVIPFDKLCEDNFYNLDNKGYYIIAKVIISEDYDEWRGFVYFDINKEYTITYNLDGGTNSLNNPTNYEYGNSVLLSDPSKSGYLFLGWYSNSEHIGDTITKIEKGDFGDKELYARFTKKHTITYHLDDDVINDENNLDYFYEDETLTFGNPVKPNCNFEGWYTDSLLNNPINDTESLTNDLDLYAKWSYSESTISPIANYGITNGSLEVKKGTIINLWCDNANADIYYTTNGEDPTISSTLFTDSIEILDDITIKAIAVAPNKDVSEIVSYSYTVKDESEDYGEILDEDIDVSWNSADDVPAGIWATDIEHKEYTGKAITCPDEFRVYYNKKLLEEGVDYTVKYSNNTNFGNGIVSIICKGNYSGTFTKEFEIYRKGTELNEIADSYLVYKGKDLKITTPKVITKDGTTLKYGTDFSYYIKKDGEFYTNTKLTSAGDYVVYVVALENSNYGFDPICYHIYVQEPIGVNISSAKISNFVSSKEYTGDEVIQEELGLACNKVSLTEGEDYEVKYINNINVGTATVIISGINDYYGAITKTFKIEGTALSKCTFNGILNVVYSNEFNYNNFYSNLYITDKTGYELERTINKYGNGDFYVSSIKNVDKAGTATVEFTGLKGYTGTVKKTFKIVQRDITDPLTNLEIENIENQEYVKGGAKPSVVVKVNEVELREGRDYTLSYKNNTKVGTDVASVTIKGKGNYKGSVTKYFTIEPKSLRKVSLTANDKVVSSKANSFKPSLTVTDIDGKKLSAGTDYEKNILYTYEYDTIVIDSSVKPNKLVIREKNDVVGNKDIIPEGTSIRVTLIGKGNYEDDISTVYNIINSQKDISKATVSIENQYYTGNPIELKNSDLTVKLNKVELESSDFTIVGYANNVNKGTASVTIKGKGEYGGTKTVSFKIINTMLALQ